MANTSSPGVTRGDGPQAVPPSPAGRPPHRLMYASMALAAWERSLSVGTLSEQLTTTGGYKARLSAGAGVGRENGVDNELNCKAIC